jgi:hypothetical protein
MTKNKNPVEKLYDYLFHYNPYQKMWYAFYRDESNQYFNGDRKRVMKNPDIDELITEIIMKDSKKDAS